MKRYQIFYEGKKWDSHITRPGAEAHAFRLAKQKGWDFAKVEIRDAQQVAI